MVGPLTEPQVGEYLNPSIGLSVPIQKGCGTHSPKPRDVSPVPSSQSPFILLPSRGRERRDGGLRGGTQGSQELQSQRRKQVRWRETEEALSSAQGGKTDAVSTDTQMSPQPPTQPRCWHAHPGSQLALFSALLNPSIVTPTLGTPTFQAKSCTRRIF